MSYQAWSVVFGEQPSASKWNILGTNDASFNDGTGIADNAIINRHLADDSVTGDNLSLTSTENILAADYNTTSTSYSDTGLKVTLSAAGTYLIICQLRGSIGAASNYPLARLYNQTTAAAIADSDRLLVFTTSGTGQATGVIAKLVTTATANNIIRVELASGGAGVTASILSNSAGHSGMVALRVG